MDAIKTFIGKHRPWLVGAGFLMVLYLYQARPFDKQAEAATAAGKSAKEMLVGKWQSQGYTEYLCSGDFPRKIGYKRDQTTRVLEIKADGTFVETENKGRIRHDGSWMVKKSLSNTDHLTCLDKIERKGKAPGQRDFIHFNVEKTYPEYVGRRSFSVSVINLSGRQFTWEATGTFPLTRSWTKIK